MPDAATVRTWVAEARTDPAGRPEGVADLSGPGADGLRRRG